MTEIIEPNPLLLEYLSIAGGLFTDFDGGLKEFVNNEEWHYIPSELEQNIYLIKRLNDKDLLSENNSVFDCGIGLATTMFDLYLQSKDIKNKTFTFGGVEKYKKYLDYLNEKLLYFWEDNLSVIEGDIMDQNYSNYNLIYTYSPFKTTDKLKEFYNKIVNDIKPGSLIIESRNYGKGLNDTLSNIDGLDEIEIDDIFIYRKKK
jgi:hypothetical protein